MVGSTWCKGIMIPMNVMFEVVPSTYQSVCLVISCVGYNREYFNVKKCGIRRVMW